MMIRAAEKPIKLKNLSEIKKMAFMTWFAQGLVQNVAKETEFDTHSAEDSIHNKNLGPKVAPDQNFKHPRDPHL